MTGKTQRIPDYLRHILQAIENVERYTDDMDEAAFLRNQLVQDAVIRNIELANPGFAQTHPEIPLAFAYEMRNALAHGYFKVDLEIVWKTTEVDLPELAASVRRIIS